MTITIDRSNWGRLRITGDDRMRFLQGLTTVNVETLADGAHAWGAILNPKGRVLTVIDIGLVGDAFLIACEASLADKTRALLEKYAVMDDVTFEPLTGPAHQVWDDPVDVWRAPVVEGAGDNAIAATDAHVERLRIHAGFLRYGDDVDEDNFPFETPLAQFLDYKKGCYVGQEPVFRVHSQGSSARILRGLVVEGDAPIAKGTQIKHAAKDKAGELTSSIAAGDGTTLALGYLHRTVWDVGGTVEIDGRRATIHELPWDMTLRRAALLAVVASGCDYVTSSFETNDFSGDANPILVDRASGGVVVGMREGTTDHTAVLDVMSPITLIDHGPDVNISITERDLTLLGARPPGAVLDLPRAKFPEKTVATLHPCDVDTCSIGTPSTPRSFDALFGLDTFAGDALRLRLGDNQIFVLPDIAGSEIRRSRACDSVLESPYRGGGTLVVAGTEIGFSNFRVAIDTCLAPNPAKDVPQSKRGADALLVVSTAIGISILDESTYARYRELDRPLIPDLATLPDDTVLLPSGPISGKLAELPSLALVGNLDASPRAPCRQVWASHLLAARDCAPGDDCPCNGDAKFCSAPAIVELAPATKIPFLVVSDSEPILQALRAELRPDRPEVDGILGADALTTLELDLDYAHDRALARCVDRTSCSARTLLSDRESRFFVNGCLGAQLPPPP